MFSSGINESIHMWQMELILGVGLVPILKINANPNLPIFSASLARYSQASLGIRLLDETSRSQLLNLLIDLLFQVWVVLARCLFHKLGVWENVQVMHNK